MLSYVTQFEALAMRWEEDDHTLMQPTEPKQAQRTAQPIRTAQNGSERVIRGLRRATNIVTVDIILLVIYFTYGTSKYILSGIRILK